MRGLHTILSQFQWYFILTHRDYSRISWGNFISRGRMLKIIYIPCKHNILGLKDVIYCIKGENDIGYRLISLVHFCSLNAIYTHS